MIYRTANQTRPMLAYSDVKPFLKWAGGKTHLINQYIPFFPKEFNNYHEPFIGSGAVFWFLMSRNKSFDFNFNRAFISDSNKELINCYIIVRDQPIELIDKLLFMRINHNKEFYYLVRNQNPNKLTSLERAARMIYLNKTCFNGLYRVNRLGYFNVPIGSYKHPRIFEEKNIHQCSKILGGVKIDAKDFHEILIDANRDDFIYMDPPYHPISSTSNFTSYTENSFYEKDQESLADIYKKLNHIGCKLMLSNSYSEKIISLYKDFRQIPISASRAINSNAERRGKIKELLIINYEI